MFPTIY